MPETPITPGLFVVEESAIAYPITGAEHITIFIGYTQKADFLGVSSFKEFTPVSSWSDFEYQFGGEPHMMFHLAISRKGVDHKMTKPRFFLPAQVKQFFNNGGQHCYIYSLGAFAETQEISIAAMEEALQALEQKEGAKLIIWPDAMAYVGAAGSMAQQQEKAKDVYRFYKKVLSHCAKTKSFVILDVWMANPIPPFDGALNKFGQYDLMSDFQWFRNHLDGAGLAFGASYYPFLNTNLVPSDKINFTLIENIGTSKDVLILDTSFDNGKGQVNNAKLFHQKYLSQEPQNLIAHLDFLTSEKLLRVELTIKEANKFKKEVLAKLPDATDAASIHALNIIIRNQLSWYDDLLSQIANELNVLPPCGSVAGAFAQTDQQTGVWKAPANIALNGVQKPVLSITNGEQEGMNNSTDGKAINAIRSFPGVGPLIWGARTLDGNSIDNQYVNVRRTQSFIQISLEDALAHYVFEPNDSNTWESVKRSFSKFLTDLWAMGALVGAKPQDSFFVKVDLHETMTTYDVNQNLLKVQVGIALMRPEEFIILELVQQLGTS
ncbi:MAG: phage tail sheath subtilisin-like domain-containing protein [Saprospiraceae bacterium]|nr:phage tail sheath subtilisin-like domain-containing protein [Saprospiraceae bacterium]